MPSTFTFSALASVSALYSLVIAPTDSPSRVIAVDTRIMPSAYDIRSLRPPSRSLAAGPVPRAPPSVIYSPSARTTVILIAGNCPTASASASAVCSDSISSSRAANALSPSFMRIRLSK